MNSGTHFLDKNKIQEQAKGQWKKILTTLGVDGAALDGKHHPCPLCGGADRFRFDDQGGKGTWFCNQCGGRGRNGGAGDGLELAHRLIGGSFPDTLKKVAELVGGGADNPRPVNNAADRPDFEKIWRNSEPATPEHQYLKIKKVKCHGARILGNEGIKLLQQCNKSQNQARHLEAGSLLLPVLSVDGALHGLQVIPGSGKNKVFVAGSLKKGHFYPIGFKLDQVLQGTIYIAEGYATAASIHEATGCPVAVSFDAANLHPVLSALRQKMPKTQMVICADNDRDGDTNTGVIKATKAAQAEGALLAIPQFPEGVQGTDFNDLAQAYGLEEVRKQVEAARRAAAECKKEVFSLSQFSLRGKASEMKEKMKNDVYVLGKLALMGEATVFYGSPNSGKTLLTLFMLIEALQAGEIRGENVFYVNADDNYRGLTQKLELAEEHGFEMLAPGQNGFKSDQLQIYLQQLVDEKNCMGKILILDTVKKFTNLMDKTACSSFSNSLRQFVGNGGTVIMLAHVNKNRDGQGKVVFTGVADLVDDVDCAYTLDVVKTREDTRSVIFENIKNRGNVEQEACYTYSCKAEIDYFARLGSIQKVTDEEKGGIEHLRRLNLMLEKNKEAIDAICEILCEGAMKKTELISEASRRSGISRKRINKALVEHRGDDINQHEFWIEEVGEHNTRTYYLNTHKPHAPSQNEVPQPQQQLFAVN